MKHDLSRFLKTVTGKAVLATGVVVFACGGAAAAGFTGVPNLIPASDEPTLEDTVGDSSSDEATEESSEDDSSDDASAEESTHGQTVSEFATTTELDGCEKGQAIAELASSNAEDNRQDLESDHDVCDDDDDEEGEQAEESATAEDSAADEESSENSSADEPTHGEIVSEFARTTELEGCEKGQAISELASSNAADHRQNPEKDNDPCDHEDEAADDSGDDGDESTGDEVEAEAEVSVESVVAPSDDSTGQSGGHGRSGAHGNSAGGGQGHGKGHGK